MGRWFESILRRQKSAGAAAKQTDKKGRAKRPERVAKALLFWYNLNMKNKLIEKDYSTYGRNYQVKLCSETEKLIPCDDKARLLNEILEEIDYTELYRTYSRIGRKPATTPVTMFKILVYGNAEGNLFKPKHFAIV